MPTRREFISGAAGAGAVVAFVGCDLMKTAHVHAQAGAPARRREVVVSGRRVKTVDVHAHCAFPDAHALLGLKINPETLIMGAERIRQMDQQGIDVEALSINPFWYKAERDVARGRAIVRPITSSSVCTVTGASGSMACTAPVTLVASRIGSCCARTKVASNIAATSAELSAKRRLQCSSVLA